MPRSTLEMAIQILASKRLARAVSIDWIGEWLIVRPAKKWAYDREGAVDVHMPTEVMQDGTLVDPTKGFWRTKLVSGLDCEWCVGMWTSALVSMPLPARVDRVRRPLVTALAVAQGVGMLTQLVAAQTAAFEQSLHVMEDDHDA